MSEISNCYHYFLSNHFIFPKFASVNYIFILMQGVSLIDILKLIFPTLAKGCTVVNDTAKIYRAQLLLY